MAELSSTQSAGKQVAGHNYLHISALATAETEALARAALAADIAGIQEAQDFNAWCELNFTN